MVKELTSCSFAEEAARFLEPGRDIEGLQKHVPYAGIVLASILGEYRPRRASMCRIDRLNECMIIVGETKSSPLIYDYIVAKLT